MRITQWKSLTKQWFDGCQCAWEPKEQVNREGLCNDAFLLWALSTSLCKKVAPDENVSMAQGRLAVLIFHGASFLWFDIASPPLFYTAWLSDVTLLLHFVLYIPCFANTYYNFYSRRPFLLTPLSPIFAFSIMDLPPPTCSALWS